jgi:hypothetical protein
MDSQDNPWVSLLMYHYVLGDGLPGQSLGVPPEVPLLKSWGPGQMDSQDNPWVSLPMYYYVLGDGLPRQSLGVPPEVPLSPGVQDGWTPRTIPGCPSRGTT